MAVIAVEQAPLGPKRVYAQALDAGFTASLEEGEGDPGKGWVVSAVRGDRMLFGLWVQPPGKGVKGSGLWVSEPEGGLRSITAAEMRSWLVRS